MLFPRTTLNCNGHLVDLTQPKVMGILNITPDSFYDGGNYNKDTTFLPQLEKMLSEGATFIDVGGMSSRPGAAIISVEEELKRVLPVIEEIKKRFPDTLISIDTIRAEVARKAVEAGAAMVNDISAASFDEKLFETVAALNVPYVLMHMQGQPKDMQTAPEYQDVVLEVLDFFIEKLALIRAAGIKDVVIDPGFGFGKTLEHNYRLLAQMHAFQILEVPILAGLSRKSMIQKALQVPATEALNGTTALHMLALQQGAKILRVHDVKEAVQTIRLFELIQEQSATSLSQRT